MCTSRVQFGIIVSDISAAWCELNAQERRPTHPKVFTQPRPRKSVADEAPPIRRPFMKSAARSTFEISELATSFVTRTAIRGAPRRAWHLEPRLGRRIDCRGSGTRSA